ncbi:MAG: hypothetical protein B6I34_04110 [Anaerolineaceae bacterium 4572_32.1]|nr:MAG: hypothetical protein B6I34_04110 [Anaerolineaceae bacterium 4572_32.1]
MIRRTLFAEYTNRFMLLVLVIALLFFLGAITESYHRRADLMAEIEPILSDETSVTLKAAPTIIALIVNLVPGVALNFLPALAALAAIPWAASRFIHTLYDTKDVKEAHDFLHRRVFGMTAPDPIMIIKDGDIDIGVGGLFDRVGGRGFVVVHNNNALVLEKGGRLTRVMGPCLGFLDSFERIWEVVDLRPQRWILTDNAMTKDGIPISCEADITFKIDDRFTDQWGQVQTKQPVETESLRPTDEEIVKALGEKGIGTPLPYTDEAVFNAATSLWVRIRQPEHKEQLRKWTGRVIISGVEGTLRSMLARYRLDWLLQPPQPGQEESPREEIRKQLEQKLQDSFSPGNKVGARILDVNLGKIDVKDKRISTQWTDAWYSIWEQRAVEGMAEGEAELARLQAAQVQAQAEMVLALTEAIRPLVTSEEALSSYKLATRFVETLWWLSYSPGTRAFLPPGTLRTLDELKKLLGDGTDTASNASPQN